LAFDTIYAEGQRRYVESLSAYARQFLGRMEKPEVDYIEGLSPAISIDQKGPSKNPRSTVGTVTETYDYLRLLFARVGHPHCPKCGREITAQTVQQIVDAIQALPEHSRIMILAPLIRDRKGEYQVVFEDLTKAGYARVRVDGATHDLSEEIPEEVEYLVESLDESLDDILIKLEPQIKAQMSAAADPIADYLLGVRQSLNVVISLEAIMESLEGILRETFLESPPADLAHLPPAELEQYFDEHFEEWSEVIPSTFELDESLLGTETPADIAEA
ncbi:unnamed protein product, partial [marine sediment metagenome]